MTPTKCLWLVDDDDIFVFLTKKTIAKTNFAGEVKTFANGIDAIEYIKQIGDQKDLLPEIIFLDLAMPVMDGWGFLDEFAIIKPRLERKITIYIVSSSVSPQDVQRAKNINDICDFIIKPVSKEKFIHIIQNL
jgi:CheY-like chemotaxis protein